MSEKPKMELIGHDGNIFSIMGRASQLLNRAGMRHEAHEMFDRVTSSVSYDEALHIISEYVETELSPATENRKRMRGQNDHER